MMRETQRLHTYPPSVHKWHKSRANTPYAMQMYPFLSKNMCNAMGKDGMFNDF